MYGYKNLKVSEHTVSKKRVCAYLYEYITHSLTLTARTKKKDTHTRIMRTHARVILPQ